MDSGARGTGGAGGSGEAGTVARAARGRTGVVAALAVCVAVATGCVAAAAGAAAGTGIYLTTRGAEGTVSADVREAADATEEVFEELDIRKTGQRWIKDDTELEIYGRLGDEEDEVTVDLERVNDELTEVEVRVRKSVATWDKETAKAILEEIRDELD